MNANIFKKQISFDLDTNKLKEIYPKPKEKSVVMSIIKRRMLT